MLVSVVVGFIRGLEASLAVSGDPRLVIVHSLGSSENLETASVPNRTPALLSDRLEGIQRWQGTRFVSPELYLGTLVAVKKGEPTFAFVLLFLILAPVPHARYNALGIHCQYL
jgi:hypothetical protein